MNEQIYLKALKESNDTTNQWRWFIHLYSRNRMKFVTINRDQSINAKGVKGDRFGKTDSFEIYIVNPTVNAILRGCHGLSSKSLGFDLVRRNVLLFMANRCIALGSNSLNCG